ncbi:MAG: 2-oxo acid dehydrogenase subunit E2 [Myxococcales bacterium]|nr:2-oxo acid dehydrogenase subunit E2 [Myxococcales bacterium]
MTTLVVLGVLVGAWALLKARSSRADGHVLRVHPYRRLLWFITPSRAQASVSFDMTLDATELVAWLEEAHPVCGAHMTHAVVAACFTALAEQPRMNRFVAGHRLYQRHGEWITFSMKRKRLDREAKVAMVKLRLEPGETFLQLCQRMEGVIGEQRSGVRTHEDAEYGLFDALPNALLELVVPLARWLDAHHLLPGFFIEGDGLFTSLVVANLGSLGMPAASHHLYEWGTCGLFVVVGKAEPVPVVEDGQVVVRQRLQLRWTFDERIDDGLNARAGLDAVRRVLEHPRAELWGEAPDGSTAPALDRGRP